MGPDLSNGEVYCHGLVVKMTQEKEEEKVKCGKDTTCCCLVVEGRSTQSKNVDGFWNVEKARRWKDGHS